ncbi:MAG: 16S rRNA (uracil(1498)-N(3))-methyltransferase [Dongiaceae bacterium]
MKRRVEPAGESGWPRTRLFVEAALTADTEIAIDGDRVHHLRNVLRLEAGEAVRLFNGRDGEWRGRIARLAKSAATILAEARLRDQSREGDLWLVFAPIKRARLDSLIEKATELGVAALLPVFTRHTAAERVNIDRLRAIATAAAEQSERLSVPTIRKPVTLDKLLADWPGGRHLLLCAEAGAAKPIAELLMSQESGDRDGHLSGAVMIGPEGGFAVSELDGLGKLPFVSAVGLGPRILRADTAALAALACWQAIRGDGRSQPPHRSS